ncbi:sensor histidine kinase [Plantactinospora sp. B5E13]|uniref:sensor histidine kinase n=1 Tax=unclassified Plantactinospora TaxID=2631981 RepID=UPI00325D96A6
MGTERAWEPSDEWCRPGPNPTQQRRDLYLGLSTAAVGMLGVVLANSMGMFPLGPPPSWLEQLTWAVAVSLPLVWRRTRPEAVTIVIAVVFIAAQARGGPETLVSSASLFVAIYTLGAWGRHRRWAARIRIGVIVAMFAWLAVSATISILTIEMRFEGAAGPLPPLLAASLHSILFNLAFFLLAYLLGNSTWVSARSRHRLRVQAEELRRSRAAEAERAVTQERVRIARELHDVVAHHVSVMGVQASAARRVMEKDREKARTALGAVEQSARTAVDELRRMLGVLRDAGGTERTGADTGGHTSGYGLDQVDSLVQGARDAGLTVAYQTFGTPLPVPESVSLAGYRIVQEALTNTIKHARAGSVDVRVRYLRHEVEVEVTDDGRALATVPSARSPQSDGLGLIGMRERVAAHDGSLEVGPRQGGGFRVRARFPVAPATRPVGPEATARTTADEPVVRTVGDEPAARTVGQEATA